MSLNISSMGQTYPIRGEEACIEPYCCTGIDEADKKRSEVVRSFFV